MSEQNNHAADETPRTDELEEPSTEKSPGEEPKAPETDSSAADHEAVGIGIVGRPQVGAPDAEN